MMTLFAPTSEGGGRVVSLVPEYSHADDRVGEFHDDRRRRFV